MSEDLLPTFQSILYDYGIIFVPRHHFLIPMLLFAVLFLSAAYICVKAGISKTVFSLPVFSSVREQACDLSFMRFLDVLLALDMPLTTSMLQAGEILSAGKRKGVEDAVQMLESGACVEGAMERTGIFTDSELWFLKNSVGRGGLKDGMAPVIEMRETTMDSRVGIAVSLIQPCVVVLAGILTGYMVLYIYGSLISLAGSLLS